jgi:Na+/glutamate symporter
MGLIELEGAMHGVGDFAAKTASEINLLAGDNRIAMAAIAVGMLTAAGVGVALDERERERQAKQESKTSTKPPGENPGR